MEQPVQEAMDRVYIARMANEDVFLWPGPEWDLLYCHEELSELARVIQKLNAPDHARNHDDAAMSLQDRLYLEYGQVLMMVLTLGIELGLLDPDRALQLATEKIYRTAAKKRGAQ
jgi:NTP pyrophosphatase (non-canonical NTP hydrolase)